MHACNNNHGNKIVQKKGPTNAEEVMCSRVIYTVLRTTEERRRCCLYTFVMVMRYA